MPERSHHNRRMNTITRAAAIFIAQGAYVGKFPFAPGTVGTLAAVVLYLGMMRLSPVPYLVLCFFLFLAGTWASGRAEVALGRKDSPTIVIDEIVGYLAAMFLLPIGWAYVVAGFFLFRLLDIVKPFPLKRLQDMRGGPGVMLDDIGAALYTNIILQVVAAVLKRQ